MDLRAKLRSSRHPTRRSLLEVGSLGAFGLLWPDYLRARSSPNMVGDRGFGTAHSCIFIFQWGGPGQQDLWDLKPEAPAEVRGEFKPQSTRVPGIHISNQLPQLAQHTDKFSLIRSVTHKDFEHGSAAYTALTGHPHPLPGTNTTARPDDFPTYGSVVTKYRPTVAPVPEAVVLGPVLHQGARPPAAGQNSGFLSRAFDPFRITADPNDPSFGVESLRTDISAERLNLRRKLWDTVERQSRHLDQAPQVRGVDSLYLRAFELLSSGAARKAFEVAAESAATRDAYGRNKFGQSLLLARRLVEAGVPMVTINWSKLNADQWDTHKNNYAKLKELLPRYDQGLAALLADLSGRGLLDSTLVVSLGEFGRTPRINKTAGRDHWPDCYSVVLGGGGVRTGEVLGSSDKFAAYPSDSPVDPGDVAATLYHCLGIDPEQDIRDPLGRPLRLATGFPIRNLLG